MFTVVCLVRSTYGRGFIATHDDEIAAEAVGLNTTRYKIVAFVVGAFFAGIAGGLYGHFKLTITPTGFDFTKSIEIVVMVILGGMGNTPGVILAAILLTLLPEVLRSVDQYRMVIYSLLLIVLMLVRPKGLFNFDYAAIASRLWRKLGRPAPRPMDAHARTDPPARQGDDPLRRPDGRQRPGPHRQRRRPGRADRAQRRRQDDRLQPGHRRLPADERDASAPTGADLAGLRPNEIVEAGIARTFQNIRLFKSLSVFDNVRVACNLHRATGPAQALVRMRAFREDEAAIAKQRRGAARPLQPAAASATRPPRAFPTASSAAWRSSAASRPGRSSSSWTSRPPA